MVIPIICCTHHEAHSLNSPHQPLYNHTWGIYHIDGRLNWMPLRVVNPNGPIQDLHWMPIRVVNPDSSIKLS